MSKPSRAGVIGLGAGRLHAKSYVAAEGAELVALCDVDEERLQEIGEMFPASALFTDYAEMFSRADLDVVSVCVPNALHREVAIAALEAGLNVLCEKPLASDLAGAQAIAEAAGRARGKLMVCYDKRYRSDSIWLRQAFRQGTLGEVYQVEAAWRRETGIPGGWFGRRAVSGGGPLVDLGVHVLDLALWVLGFPAIKTVSGATRAAFGPRGRKAWDIKGTTNANDYDVEDGAVGFLRLEGGVPLLLEASWADHRRPGEDDFCLRLAGTEAAAVMHVRNYAKEDTLRLYTEVAGAPVEVIPRVRPSKLGGHGTLIADFVRAIRECAPSPAPAAQGLVAVRILDALYRSAATGREIVLNS